KMCAEMMSHQPCPDCMAKAATYIPCEKCIAMITTCHFDMDSFRCDEHKAACAAHPCPNCTDKTMCDDCLKAFFQCERCLGNMVCAQHVSAIAACKACQKEGRLCATHLAECSKCDACAAVHAPHDEAGAVM
ncbi:MAG: hypothetical protein ABI743_10560, partial [bacterium]